MNILYVSSKTGWGGIMSWMVQTAEGLEEKNHKVWILSNPKSKLNKQNYPNLRIIEKSLGPDYNPFAIYKIVKFIKKNSIDILVSNIKKEIIAAGLASRITGIPIIRRVGLPIDLNKRSKKFHQKYIAHSIIPAKYILSKSMKTEKWINKSDFTVIYNGRKPQKFSSDQINSERKRWGILSNEIILGITVKLSPMKNVEGLIRVFNSLCKTRNNIKLVITGLGGEKEKLEELIAELNINDKIIFNGFTLQPQFIASCYDIAILNSNEEGFPNSLVEYMSVGKPVISTNVGGVSEILIDNFNGLLIKPGNDIELEQSIIRLLDDSRLRKELGDNAQKTIEQKFSSSKMIRDLENVFGRFC